MIIGEKVFIRAVEEEDLPEMHKWSSDFEIIQLHDFKINFANFTTFTGKVRDEGSGRSCIDLAIVEKETKKPVGRCMITDIDYPNKKCLCTLFIGDSDSREKGYGTEALQLTMKLVFGDLNLNRMGIWVFDFNKRAIKSYKRCGMKVEGIMREGVYRNGKFHDVYFMGILKSEYEEVAKGGSIECSEASM